MIWYVDRQIQRWAIKVSSDMKGYHKGGKSKLQFLNFLGERTKINSLNNYGYDRSISGVDD